MHREEFFYAEDGLGLGALLRTCDSSHKLKLTDLPPGTQPGNPVTPHNTEGCRNESGLTLCASPQVHLSSTTVP